MFCIFKTNLPAEYKVHEDVINIETSLNEKALNDVNIYLLLIHNISKNHPNTHIFQINIVQIIIQKLQAEQDDEDAEKFSNMRFEFMIKG